MKGTLLCFALFLGAMVACLITGQSFLWALVLGLALFAVHGHKQGHSLRAMWDMAWSEGRRVLIVLRIFLFIGAITALWRSSGTIVFFIYYGVQAISPKLFVLVAFLLTALILPTRCYEVLPIAVMLGSIFTLSRLASTSQFTVLRVSGIGPWRFCGMLLMPGIVLVICAYLLGNLVAPPAQRLAKEFKLDISGSAFTGKELDSGIWVRDVQRNEAGEPKKISFVNVQRLRPGEAAYDWVIYVFDRPDHLTSIVTAKSGTYSEQEGWVLYDVVEETVPTLPKESREQTQARVERKVMKSMVWGKSLDGNIFGLLMIKPEDMSLQELHYYIEYLKENGQTYKRFDTAFWSKAFYPLAILVMLLLSMPFAYQNARAGGMAIKIFCGIMIGIFYYALNNLFAFMSALDSVPSIISAILPSVMMTLAAIIAMWYVERRS